MKVKKDWGNKEFTEQKIEKAHSGEAIDDVLMEKVSGGKEYRKKGNPSVAVPGEEDVNNH